MCVYIYIYIYRYYLYMSMYMYMSIYIYIYICRGSEQGRLRDLEAETRVESSVEPAAEEHESY